jgi:hypothetical protein
VKFVADVELYQKRSVLQAEEENNVTAHPWPRLEYEDVRRPGNEMTPDHRVSVLFSFSVSFFSTG